jgi:hypothetical protein
MVHGTVQTIKHTHSNANNFIPITVTTMSTLSVAPSKKAEAQYYEAI